MYFKYRSANVGITTIPAVSISADDKCGSDV